MLPVDKEDNVDFFPPGSKTRKGGQMVTLHMLPADKEKEDIEDFFSGTQG